MGLPYNAFKLDEMFKFQKSLISIININIICINIIRSLFAQSHDNENLSYWKKRCERW